MAWLAPSTTQGSFSERSWGHIHPKVTVLLHYINTSLPLPWPLDAESWLIWKDPDAGKDWGQEKGTTEDEMVGWHHWHNRHGFGWTPRVGDGQGGLVCCGSWGQSRTRLSDWTELDWTLTLLHGVYFITTKHCTAYVFLCLCIICLSRVRSTGATVLFWRLLYA